GSCPPRRGRNRPATRDRRASLPAGGACRPTRPLPPSDGQSLPPASEVHPVIDRCAAAVPEHALKPCLRFRWSDRRRPPESFPNLVVAVFLAELPEERSRRGVFLPGRGEQVYSNTPDEILRRLVAPTGIFFPSFPFPSLPFRR